MHNLSVSQLKQVAKYGELHCVQCRRPFDIDSCYKVGRIILCTECWQQIVLEFDEAFSPDRQRWIALEVAKRRNGYGDFT